MSSPKQKVPMRWLSFLPAVVLAMLVLAGCQGLTTSPSPAAVSATLTAEAQSTKTPEQRRLEETVWVLESINGEPALPDVEVILEFSGIRLKGYTGCNRYEGPYERSDYELDIDEVAITEQDCPQKTIMEQERRYEDMLWDVTTYVIENDTLTLKTDSGETLIFMSRQ